MLKEMAWLAADFASERKRQLASGKKLAGGVEQYLKNANIRRARELAEAELQRRRRAGKLSRHVRGWWHKVERVIAYKQKVHADVERRKAMNKQLVALVHQTERYGETLQHSACHEEKGGGQVTIEEALAAASGSNTRSSKSTTTDYARLNQQEETHEFYGTTTSDSGSDASFYLEAEDSTDDESTLLEAQARELAERRAREESDEEDDDASYYADPNELQKLKEEADMQVDQVVERFRQEAEQAVQNVANIPEQVDDAESVSTRRVRFAGNIEQSTAKGEIKEEDATKMDDQEPKPAETTRVTRKSSMPETDPGNEADDDGDISDVEDFVDEQVASDDGSDEFEADRDEKDDETTIEAEERLGRDMSAADEINLLQQEGEMSIEELRNMYSSVDNGSNEHDEEEDPSESGESASSSTHQHAQMPSTDNGSAGIDESMFDADDTAEQDEFQPDAMDVDDETTMEAEERLGREMSHEQEMSLLEKEGEIPIEQLRAMYAEMASNSNNDEMSIDSETQSQTSQNDSSLGNMLFDDDDHESEDEFRPAMEDVDDETTMEAEERLGREISVEDEIALLQKEGETPVEHLRSMYNQKDDSSSDTNKDQTRRQGRKRSRPESDGSDSSDDGDAALEALKVAEEKARTTYATRPFLIAPWVKLREYQQIGLNWLVSIQTRRLNAILADEMVSFLNFMFRRNSCLFQLMPHNFNCIGTGIG